MMIGEYKQAKDQMNALKKRISIEKRKSASEGTVFSPMKRLLSHQDSPRSRATARAAARARLVFAQAAHA